MSLAPPQPTTDLALWEEFQSGRLSDQDVEGSLTLRRWKRSLDAGLSAENPGDPVMALSALGEARETFAPLLAPGAPFDAFATAMAQAGFCGLFCDADGVIVSRRIAEPFETVSARTSLVEGAVWNEGARGTNGVGTSLAEHAPVTIVGYEHFERRNHVLACYAAPVRDIRERIVAVLDASGPTASAAPFVHASVVATAAALEALIVARTYDAAIPGGLFELERLLARLPHATMLVESTGRLRRTNDRFRSLLPRASGSELAQRLGPSLAGEMHAFAKRAENLPDSVRGFRLEIEPLGDPGDPFAALVHIQPRSSAARIARAKAARDAFSTIVGSDATVATARDRARRFAPTDLPVLLLAETGAGKEVFARAIHNGSTRSTGPFVAVNCGALSGTLLESELFGYGPGAFTGAASRGQTGKLAAADGGTLFLDEVGEMTISAQATLLRFLEDGTYYRVGEASERRADVRLIAATSRELPALVAEGRFRNDLYFRMRGVVLRLPPLRERTDRRELALALLERIAQGRKLPKPLGASRAALDWIDRHEWPGNVRELRTALEVAVVMAGDAPRIELWHLPSEDDEGPREATDMRLHAERAALTRALDQSGGNLSEAARALGVARSTLYRMMGRHDLRPGGGE